MNGDRAGKLEPILYSIRKLHDIEDTDMRARYFETYVIYVIPKILCRSDVEDLICRGLPARAVPPTANMVAGQLEQVLDINCHRNAKYHLYIMFSD